jgi:hypothetical protein
MLGPPPAAAATTIGGIVRPLRFGGPLEEGLKGGNGVGKQRCMAAALDGEAKRAVERGQVTSPQPLGLSLPKPHPGERLAALDLVFDGCGVAADRDHRGKRFEAFPGRRIDERGGIQVEARLLEALPRPHRLELCPEQAPDGIRGNRGQGSSRPAPELVESGNRPAQAAGIVVLRPPETSASVRTSLAA